MADDSRRDSALSPLDALMAGPAAGSVDVLPDYSDALPDCSSAGDLCSLAVEQPIAAAVEAGLDEFAASAQMHYYPQFRSQRGN